MRDPQPPLEYLVGSSQTSLEAFELARLNRWANLRKELRDILDEWLHTEVDARIARWILECRRVQNGDFESLPAPQTGPVRIGQLAMSFLPESGPREGARGEIAQAVSDEIAGVGTEVAALAGNPALHGPRVPMTLNDAAASLRLLEQFLARPAQSAEIQAANSQCGATGVAVSSENQPIAEREAPTDRRDAGDENTARHPLSARRRTVRSTPHTRNAFLLPTRRGSHNLRRRKD